MGKFVMTPGPPVAPGRQPLPASPRRLTASKASAAPRYVRRPARVSLTSERVPSSVHVSGRRRRGLPRQVELGVTLSGRAPEACGTVGGGLAVYPVWLFEICARRPPRVRARLSPRSRSKSASAQGGQSRFVAYEHVDGDDQLRDRAGNDAQRRDVAAGESVKLDQLGTLWRIRDGREGHGV